MSLTEGTFMRIMGISLFKIGVFRPLTFEVVIDVFVAVSVSLVVHFSLLFTPSILTEHFILLC